MNPNESVSTPIYEDLSDVQFGADDVPLRLATGADIVAVIPYLLGFHPRESIVVMVTAQRRVVLTARFPFEILDRPVELQFRMNQITSQHPGAQWLLTGYSEDREYATTGIERLIDYLGQIDGSDVVDALVVSQGRFWSLMCNDELCCPAEGQPFDSATSAIAAQAVVHGLQAMPDRDDLKQRVRPPRGWAARAATQRVEEAFEQIRQLGLDGAEPLFEDLLDSGLEDPDLLDDYELAQFAVLAFIPTLRDLALRRIHRWEADRHVMLWQRVAKATPRAYQASVLAVLGLASWVSGDGAMQVICLERGEQLAPGHSLLGLLDEINRMAVPPTMWEQLLADLPRPLPKVGLP